MVVETERCTSGMYLRIHSAASTGSGGPSTATRNSWNVCRKFHEDVEITHTTTSRTGCGTALLREVSSLRCENRDLSLTPSCPVPTTTVTLLSAAMLPSSPLCTAHISVTAAPRTCARAIMHSLTARSTSDDVNRKIWRFRNDRRTESGKRRHVMWPCHWTGQFPLLPANVLIYTDHFLAISTTLRRHCHLYLLVHSSQNVALYVMYTTPWPSHFITEFFSFYAITTNLPRQWPNAEYSIL